MILQYLSYASSCERGDETNYVGFYVKLQNSFIETTKRKDMNDVEDWKAFFLHYFNLILGESILITIKDLLEKKKISITDEKEFVQRVLFIFFSHTSYDGKNSIRDLIDIFKRERNKYATYPRSKGFLSAHFVYDFISLVEEYIAEFKGKFFYMLIDEYDKLDEDQQKVTNIYIADRGAPFTYRVSFKIGVKLFEMCYDTIDNQMLDPIDDYQWVPLDRFETEKEHEFIRRLKEIGETRLRFYDYRNDSLAELLPSDERGFENGDYSGLENILALSSFLVRDFLELLKDMIYYAYPWITSEKRDTIAPIPPKIQNLVIRAHSNILYTTKIDEIPGKIDGLERKALARLLVEKMGTIFQRVLRGSRSAEKRTVSSFQLRNEIDLSEKARTALTDCRSVGALQVPFTARAPQNYARYAPHRKYEFHRLLCPQFGLSLARRWPREISAEQFNQIFETPDQAVDEISIYFLSNIFIEEFIEWASSALPQIGKLKDIYLKVCEGRYEEKNLFGEIGQAEILPTLDTGVFTLKMGKKNITCQSREEAEYARIFADVGLKEVVVPRDIEVLRQINQEIADLAKTINYELSKKLEISPQLWKKKEYIISEIWKKIVGSKQ
jgi:hypothetical protein